LTEYSLQLIKSKINPALGNPFSLPQNYYFYAIVFQTKKQMWRHGRKQDANASNYGAIVMPQIRVSYKDGTENILDHIGYICFQKNALVLKF